MHWLHWTIFNINILLLRPFFVLIKSQPSCKIETKCGFHPRFQNNFPTGSPCFPGPEPWKYPTHIPFTSPLMPFIYSTQIYIIYIYIYTYIYTYITHIIHVISIHVPSISVYHHCCWWNPMKSLCPPCFSMAEPPKRRPTVEDGEGRADAAEVVIRPGLEGGQHLGGPHEEKNAELHSYWTLPFLMRKITIFNGKYGGIYPLFIGKSSINGIYPLVMSK